MTSKTFDQLHGDPSAAGKRTFLMIFSSFFSGQRNPAKNIVHVGLHQQDNARAYPLIV